MKKKVSLNALFISSILTGIITFVMLKTFWKAELPNQIPISQNCDNTMSQTRLKEYTLIEPLLLTDIFTESASLISLKTKIEQYISLKKSKQEVDDVSVYFRKLNNGSWFNINPNTTYNPASMSKLIELITYLKEAEENPEILDKKIFFPRHFTQVSAQNIKDFQLKEKVSYTVRDLLTYMIKYSDNDATILLNLNINMRIYNQLFLDLKIPAPPTNGEYFITSADFSKFFRILYNATYLQPKYSEFGLRLLTTSTFKEGLQKGVDSSIVMAHKFGERILGNKIQFHEFGIVYIKDNPYLIGVMTTGASLKQLIEVVAEISRITYLEYKTNNDY